MYLYMYVTMYVCMYVCVYIYKIIMYYKAGPNGFMQYFFLENCLQ